MKTFRVPLDLYYIVEAEIGPGGDFSEYARQALRENAAALTGDAGKVAHWMGHEGDSGTIHRHYRGLATKAQAEAFFGLRP